MRKQRRWIACDYNDCAEEFAEDQTLIPSVFTSAPWDLLELAAREDGWSCEHGRHLCPQHNEETRAGL